MTESAGNEEIEKLYRVLQQEKRAGQSCGTPENNSRMGTVDLTILLTQMAALQTEVRKETKAVRTQRQELAESIDALSISVSNSVKGQTSDLKAHKQKADKATIKLLVELSDRLDSSIETAFILSEPKRIFFVKRRDPAAAALYEGLQMTQRWIQDRLASYGVSQIVTENCPFNPEQMEAVQIEYDANIASGLVLREVKSGYAIDSTLFRCAHVVVNGRKDEQK